MRALLVLVAAASVAHAEPLERLSDGAPLYASLRPLAAMGLLKRMGAGELPEVKQLSAQLGGMDPLSPALLATTGLDVAAPIVALLETVPGRRGHIRLIATVTAPSTFNALLGVLASGQGLSLKTVDPSSPLGKAGVFATAQASGRGVAVGRFDGPLAIVDYVEPNDAAAKPMTPAEIVKRFPLKAAKPFTVDRGARKLFSPDAALVLYADGHKLPDLLAAFDEKPAGKAETQCLKQWNAVPGAFDDVALSIGVDPDGVGASLAWGSHAGAPPLKLTPVDDGAFDLAVLKSAPAVLALYAATLAPFAKLPRSGPLANGDALTASANKCGAPAFTTLFARSWPQAIGAFLSGGGAGNPMQANMLAAFGNLRSVVLVLRDLSKQTAKWAVGATLDPQAKTLIDLFLAGAGGNPTPLKVGKRAPMVYHLNLEGTAASAGVETLASGPLSFLVADSDESLGWSLRTTTPMPGKTTPSPAEATPIAAAYLDGVQLARIIPELHIGSREDEKTMIQLLTRLRRVDARLTADGDLFRLTVRAPVKQ
jgi:hypothetical protein